MAAVLAKLDGLSEYDVRRPLTATGANLLGLVKHLATWEARYLGEVFDRPVPEPLPRWDVEEERLADMWATGHESRADIVDRYRRVWAHGEVPLFNILGHLLAGGHVSPAAPATRRTPIATRRAAGLGGRASGPPSSTRRHLGARRAQLLDDFLLVAQPRSQ